MQVFRSEADFKKLASDVVNDFIDRGVPLESGLVKVSEEAGLNPDQISSLTQMTNSMAHMTLFDRQDSGDKNIKFATVDPNAVLRSVYGSANLGETVTTPEATETEKTADFFGDFPDLVTPCESEQEKAASEETPVEKAAVLTPHQRSVAVVRLEKVADELKHRRLSIAFEYKECLDKLASEFAKLYGPDYNEFEKIALLLRGESSHGILADIRTCLRMDLDIPEAHSNKLATMVDSGTEEIQALDTLIKLSQEHDDCAAGEELLRKGMGKL
jgi:hypothetical protein